MQQVVPVNVVEHVAVPSQQSVDVLLFTSPAPTGKTFLATNVAASLSEKFDCPVTLIDFSESSGAVTYVNPISRQTVEGWVSHRSQLFPRLSLFTLDTALPVEEALEQINIWKANSIVILDVPWDSPYFDALSPIARLVAVVNTDYHHWTRWVKEVKGTWDGEVWLNEATDGIDMNEFIESAWGIHPSHTVPYLKEARASLFKGQLLAKTESYQELFLPVLWKEENRIVVSCSSSCPQRAEE